MAALTHLHPDGGRFTDRNFGAFYAAKDLATAVAETRFHRERFLRRTDEPPQEIDMRAYVARLDGYLHDLRGHQMAQPELFAPDSYAAGQQLGRELRESGSNGLIYPSVRHDGGTCVAVYRPRCLTRCVQERHLAYRWNGERITEVYEKREYRSG
jgi:RES domain-containing protein